MANRDRFEAWHLKRHNIPIAIEESTQEYDDPGIKRDWELWQAATDSLLGDFEELAFQLEHVELSNHSLRIRLRARDPRHLKLCGWCDPDEAANLKRSNIEWIDARSILPDIGDYVLVAMYKPGEDGEQKVEMAHRVVTGWRMSWGAIYQPYGVITHWARKPKSPPPHP